MWNFPEWNFQCGENSGGERGRGGIFMVGNVPGGKQPGWNVPGGIYRSPNPRPPNLVNFRMLMVS